MKKLILLIICFVSIAMSSEATVTVTVTNTSVCGNFCCTYCVRMKQFRFTNGTSYWYATVETAKCAHTLAYGGGTYTWNINPPAGYTPEWSTLQIGVAVSSYTYTFENFSTLEDCNCNGCPDYATLWDRNSDGDYNVYGYYSF